MRVFEQSFVQRSVIEKYTSDSIFYYFILRILQINYPRRIVSSPPTFLKMQSCGAPTRKQTQLSPWRVP